MPLSSRVLRPDNSGGKPTCPNDWGELGGRLSVAVANSRRSKPSDARSTATDLVTNTSRGVHAEGAGEPRAVAAASAEWHSARLGRERHRLRPVLRECSKK